MEPGEQTAPKQILPGIRGGLIAVLVLLILQLVVLLGVCWMTLFGFGSEIGYVDAIRNNDLNGIPPVQLAYVAFDILQPFLLALYAAYVLYLFVNTRRSFPTFFIGGVVLGIVLLFVDALAYYSLFGEAPKVRGPGVGLLTAVGIYQYLIISPRTKAIFVN